MLMRYGDVVGSGDNDNLYILLPQGTARHLRGPSRYVSQFAKKVRDDANQCKTACWSTMGIPSTELDPPSSFLRKYSRQLPFHMSVDIRDTHNNSKDLTRPFRTGPRLSLRSNSSIHQSLPQRNMGRSSLPNIGQGYNNNNNKMRQQFPILVRNKRQANFRDADFALPPINGTGDNNNSRRHPGHNGDKDQDFDKYFSNDKDQNNNKNISEKEVSFPELESTHNKEMRKIGENCEEENGGKYRPAVNLKDAIYGRNGVIDKRNVLCSIPHLLNPTIPVNVSATPQKQDQVVTTNVNNHQGQGEAGQNVRPDSKIDIRQQKQQQEQDLCDAFILRKILELRGVYPPSSDNSSNCDSDLMERGDNSESTSKIMSDCYNGKVGYIERGEKDFLLENALKCTRMPAKIPQKKIVDDWHGNGQLVDTRRMVFKHDYGQVPEYLKRRKAKLEDEKEVLSHVLEDEANKECRQLTEDERTQIISGLNQSWEELYVEFQKLPLFSSSPRVIKRKAEIETRLRDLESDLRLITRHGRLFVSSGASESPFLWQ